MSSPLTGRTGLSWMRQPSERPFRTGTQERRPHMLHRHRCSSEVSSTSIVQSSAAAIPSKSEVVKSTAPFIFRKNAGLLIPAFSYKSFAVIPSSFFLRVMDSISICCVVVGISTTVQVPGLDQRYPRRHASSSNRLLALAASSADCSTSTGTPASCSVRYPNATRPVSGLVW